MLLCIVVDIYYECSQYGVIVKKKKMVEQGEKSHWSRIQKAVIFVNSVIIVDLRKVGLLLRL